MDREVWNEPTDLTGHDDYTDGGSGREELKARTGYH
jgi:hypothetical protein